MQWLQNFYITVPPQISTDSTVSLFLNSVRVSIYTKHIFTLNSTYLKLSSINIYQDLNIRCWNNAIVWLIALAFLIHFRTMINAGLKNFHQNASLTHGFTLLSKLGLQRSSSSVTADTSYFKYSISVFFFFFFLKTDSFRCMFPGFQFNFFRRVVLIPSRHPKGMINFRAAIKRKKLQQFRFPEHECIGCCLLVVFLIGCNIFNTQDSLILLDVRYTAY
jgi:hypothetical protein